MKEVRAACEDNPARNTFNIDETGIQWRLLPRQIYLSVVEDKRTVRGTEGMDFKDRFSPIVCSNANGTAKVELTIIGKANNLRRFRRRGCPIRYFAQANAWSDYATFLKRWEDTSFRWFGDGPMSWCCCSWTAARRTATEWMTASR